MQRWFFMGSLVLISMASFYMLYQQRAYINDDTFITLRYAQNILEGRGFVWNPEEHVEGYTSFLALLLITLLGKLGMDLVAAAQTINFFAFLSMGLFFLFSRKASKAETWDKQVWYVIPFLLIMLSLPMITWVWGGLEGPLFAALVLWSFGRVGEHIEKMPTVMDAFWTGGLLGLLPLTRPDGYFFFFWAWALAFVQGWRRKGQRNFWWLLSGVMLVLPAAHQLFRFAYYGTLVPNTVLAKTVGIPNEVMDFGWSYAVRWFAAPPFLPWLALAASWFLWRQTPMRTGVLFIGGAILGYLALIIKAGGDLMPRFRLLLPLIPLAVLLIAYACDRLAQAPKVSRLWFALIGLALFIWDQVGAKPLLPDAAALVGSKIGYYIQQNWPAGSRIALNTAGSIPYIAKENIYKDMLGLNDSHIARRKIKRPRLLFQTIPGHAKGDGNYVLEGAPDYIILGPAQGISAEVIRNSTLAQLRYSPAAIFLSDLELVENPQFGRKYSEHTIGLAPGRLPNGMETPAVNFTFYQRLREAE